MTIYNFYCDESCHLPNDNSLGGANKKILVLGGVEIPKAKKIEICTRIKEIKLKHNISKYQELKWTKISPTNVPLYLDIIDYFFDCDDIIFRGLVAKDKDNLDHTKFNQSFDDWYYKMYWQLLNVIDPRYYYNIFIDIKDTNGGSRIKKLHDVLCNSKYDFNRKIIRQVQQVRSHEIEIIQIADIFTGALAYIHRNLKTSKAKSQIIDRIKMRSKYKLLESTLRGEQKFNLFIWKPNYVNKF